MRNKCLLKAQTTILNDPATRLLPATMQLWREGAGRAGPKLLRQLLATQKVTHDNCSNNLVPPRHTS